jgi:hypothetical protein
MLDADLGRGWDRSRYRLEDVEQLPDRSLTQ